MDPRVEALAYYEATQKRKAEQAKKIEVAKALRLAEQAKLTEANPAAATVPVETALSQNPAQVADDIPKTEPVRTLLTMKDWTYINPDIFKAALDCPVAKEETKRRKKTTLVKTKTRVETDDSDNSTFDLFNSSDALPANPKPVVAPSSNDTKTDKTPKPKNPKTLSGRNLLKSVLFSRKLVSTKNCNVAISALWSADEGWQDYLETHAEQFNKDNPNVTSDTEWEKTKKPLVEALVKLPTLCTFCDMCLFAETKGADEKMVTTVTLKSAPDGQDFKPPKGDVMYTACTTKS